MGAGQGSRERPDRPAPRASAASGESGRTLFDLMAAKALAAPTGEPPAGPPVAAPAAPSTPPAPAARPAPPAAAVSAPPAAAPAPPAAAPSPTPPAATPPARAPRRAGAAAKGAAAKGAATGGGRGSPSEYRAKDIQVLEGLEAVRRRPGMYIGGVDGRGLHHLVWEIVDNAIDEVMNGFATTVEVTLARDRRSIAIEDDGRGIPVDEHPEKKKPALEVILTTLHSGAKFDQGTYLRSGGLHGVGSSVVNALSVSLTATVKRDGFRWRQRYARGVALGPLERVGPCRGTGTTIEFAPDPEIFPVTELDVGTIRRSLEDRAYLHRGLGVVFRDEATGLREEIRHPDGIRAFLDHLIAGSSRQAVAAQAFYFERDAGPLRCECALQWTTGQEPRFQSYVNGIRTLQGGTHEAALRQCVAAAVRSYIDTHEVKLPKGVEVAPDDAREGVVGIISVFFPEPQFQGQTKDRLHAPDLKAPLEQSIRPALEGFLHENKSVAETVIERVITSARARLASREAAEKVRRASPGAKRLSLPGKLADCASTRPDECELFIVEGDSAGGTAKQGRDRRTQAVLPLRGKVLNAEQASASKLSANKELENVVQALGCGIGKGCDPGQLRYRRVVLLMDADADGHHISTLLMTFFYRFMPEVVRRGHLYLAEPPLYKVTVKGKVHWVADDQALERLRQRMPKAALEIQRFKGLGEMSAKELAETTLSPETRRLLRIEVDDPEEADRTLRDLMGKDPEPRFRLIMDRAAEAGDLDV